MDHIYVVYLYCDYRKEVDIQHLRAFTNRDEAIQFAQKYANPTDIETEYVCIRGTEFDAPFYTIDECQDGDEFRQKEAIECQLKKELSVKKGMWYIRIAVDKVIFHHN